jgi:GAF domain-containing protein
MLKENELIGWFTIYRQEVRPFSDKQIELVQNFAAQAVIAIENARLLSELRQRTAELTDSLEQQTATSEVLQVVSRSPADVQPVFAAMLESAVRICDAGTGGLYRWDGDALHLLASNTPAQFVKYRKKPFRPDPKNHAAGRMVATKSVVQVADLRAEPTYMERSDPQVVATVELAGARTVLCVRSFEEKHIALLKAFADQAVIAIENVRLFKTEQQRSRELAESEVLQAISVATRCPASPSQR